MNSLIALSCLLAVALAAPAAEKSHAKRGIVDFGGSDFDHGEHISLDDGIGHESLLGHDGGLEEMGDYHSEGLEDFGHESLSVGHESLSVGHESLSIGHESHGFGTSHSSVLTYDHGHPIFHSNHVLHH